MIRLLGDVVISKPVKIKGLDDEWLNVANLEGPLLGDVRAHKKQPKAGPHLYSEDQFFPRRVFGVVSLANNHVMDYGWDGVSETCDRLRKLKIRFGGVGKKSERRGAETILNVRRKKVGIIFCGEKQFGVASKNRPGVVAEGPWVVEAIGRLKLKTDSVIVGCHMGAELSPVPHPEQRELYRAWVEAGADIVWGHHPHIPQGYEKYKQGAIFYGLGNFVVDVDKWQHVSEARWSMVVEIKRLKPLIFEIKTYEIVGGDGKIEVRKSSKKESAKRQKYLKEANRVIENEELYEGVWQEIAVASYEKWLASYLGFRKPTKDAVRLIGDVFRQRGKVSQEQLLLWYHIFANRSHRVSVETALGVLGGEVEDLRTERSRKWIRRNCPWIG